MPTLSTLATDKFLGEAECNSKSDESTEEDHQIWKHTCEDTCGGSGSG